MQSIRDTALVLRTSENEAQVVERIVEGITPTQRARFVFQAPPSSFLELEQLAVIDRKSANADQTRTFQSTAVTAGVVETHPNLGIQGTLTLRRPRLRDQVNLLFISIAGSRDILKKCFLRLAQLRQQEQPVAISQP